MSVASVRSSSPHQLCCRFTSNVSIQVIQAPEPAAPAEQVITLEETQLAGSQVFVTLPDPQTSQNSSELVAVTVEDLLDGTVTLICGEAK